MHANVFGTCEKETLRNNATLYRENSLQAGQYGTPCPLYITTGDTETEDEGKRKRNECKAKTTTP